MEADVPSDVISPAMPIAPLAQPVYPARALAAKAGFASVALKLTIDTLGRVTDIATSTRRIALPNAWAEEFRAAAEAAVARWRFRPAVHAVVKRVKDENGDDDLKILSSEPAEWECDVVFMFAASGAVASDVAAR